MEEGVGARTPRAALPRAPGHTVPTHPGFERTGDFSLALGRYAREHDDVRVRRRGSAVGVVVKFHGFAGG